MPRLNAAGSASPGAGPLRKAVPQAFGGRSRGKPSREGGRDHDHDAVHPQPAR